MTGGLGLTEDAQTVMAQVASRECRVQHDDESLLALVIFCVTGVRCFSVVVV